MGQANVMLRRPGAGRHVLVVVAGITVAAALFALAGFFAEGEAAGHVRLHGALAFVVLLIAGTIVLLRPPPTIAGRAPVIGLAFLAAAQLIESIGAIGYGPDNDTRRLDIVVLHDVGVAANGLALFALVAAVALAAGSLVKGRYRGGMLVPGLAMAVVAAAGLLFVWVMVGGL